MSTTRNTSCTTTNLAVGDSENTRIPALTATPSPATVEAQGVKPLKRDSQGNSYSVGSQVTVGPIKEVDSRVLIGSHGVGDHRIVAQPAKLPSNPDPRSGMTQAPFSKFQSNPPFMGILAL